jgi:hypothetical protein
MKEKNNLKDIRYNASFIPIAKASNLEDSIDQISQLDLKRGVSFLDIKIIYKNKESYNLKYYFKERYYLKSYVFKQGKKSVIKEGLSIKNKKDIEELNLFVAKHFNKVFDSNYKLKTASLPLERLMDDLKGILKVFFLR